MKRKVLHIVNGEHYAGAERVQDLLAVNLPQFGYDVGFVVLKEGQFAEKRTSQMSPLYTLPMIGRTDIGPARTIASLIRHSGYDLVHTHTPRTAMMGALASVLSGVPMIHHIHGPTHVDTEQRWRNYRNVFVERLSLWKARHCIAVSSYANDYARGIGIPRHKMHVVPNGVPAPNCARSTDDDGPLVVGTAALFRPKKGVEVLLEAFANVAKQSARPMRLNLIGRFETEAYRRAVEHFARERGVLDRVKWIGFTSDVYGELRRLSVFVLPSLYGEGLPMVILEAMALGLPVVASRVGGIDEAVHHGKHGVLVEPGDARQLASAIGAIVTGRIDGAVLGRNARARHQEAFSDRSMAGAVARIYDQALVGHVRVQRAVIEQGDGGYRRRGVGLRQE